MKKVLKNHDRKEDSKDRAIEEKKKIKSQSNELEKVRRIIINSIKEHI